MSSFDSKSEYLNKLILVLDLVIVASVYVAALRVYQVNFVGKSFDAATHLSLLPVILLIFSVSRNLVNKELKIHGQLFSAQVTSIVKEVAMTIAVMAVLILLLELDQFSRAVLITFSIGVTFSLVVARYFLVWFYFGRRANSVETHLQVLIVGSGRRARLLGDQLQVHSEWGVHIVGYLDPTGKSAGRRMNDEILGHVNDIGRILRDNVVEDVIVALPRSMLGDVQKIIDACQEEGVRLRFMADFYEFEAARLRLTEIGGIPLLSFEPVARDEGALLAKRIFDLVVTLASMPIVLPLLLLIAVAIRLDSKGPVIFMQDRIGLHKRAFKMYKFRSMWVDAEERLAEVEHLNEADGPNFKIKDDPRITRIGRFIRKSSIDELPQLFNVISGDMSLVGPRPMSKRDVSLFDKGVQRKRFSVRPGITCLWQISGRSDLSFEEWLKLDLQYIDNWSFWLDLKVLLKTIPAVLKGGGAA